MFKKLILFFIAALSMLQAKAAIIPDSIAAHFEDRVTANIEGVWQFSDDGATIAIYADSNTLGDYVITCLDSPDLRLESGAKLGWARSSLSDGEHYKAKLYTNISDDGKIEKSHNFNVTLKANTLELVAVKSGVKLDLWMLYRFFVTMSLHRNTNNEALKARRIYPPVPTGDCQIVL